MLAYGQPLHAFDAGKIRGGKLIARRAAAGEQIVTLDGVQRTLDDQMLVIADVERPLVIAGVFGSQDAEIDEHTTDIVLEAANFAGPSILRTELHTGIRSEASNRFEKGIDPNLVPGALDFAGRMFAELCGGAVAPGMVDAGGVPPAPAPLSFRPGRANALLGYEVPAAEQSGILRRLECEVEEDGAPVAARDADAADVWTVTPATFRPDLVREVDLIEEVGRIAGYGAAPGDAAAARHGRRPHQGAARAARRAERPGRLRPRRGPHLHLHRPGRAGSARPPGGRRPARPGPALQPDERRPVRDAHHAASRAAQGGQGQRRPAQRPAEPVRDRQGLPVGRAGPGARARGGAGRRAAARAGGRRHRPLGAAAGRGLDRRPQADRLLHAQGLRGRAPCRRRPERASTSRSATRRSTSPTCTPASPPS